MFRFPGQMASLRTDGIPGSPQQSNNLHLFPNIYGVFLATPVHNVCLDGAVSFGPRARAKRARTERISMQSGSVIRAERQRGPDVWEFRWREQGADGKRKHRRMVLGSVEQLTDEAAARQAISSLLLELNRGSAWLKTRSSTLIVTNALFMKLQPMIAAAHALGWLAKLSLGALAVVLISG
jgi:hypothetical protein